MKSNINIIKPNVWNNKTYKVTGLVDQKFVKTIMSRFWAEIMIHLRDDQYVLLIWKVRYIDGSYASLSHIQKVNLSDLELILENFNKLTDIKSEDYFTTPVDKVVVAYRLISDEKLLIKKSKITEIKPKDLTPVTRMKGYNFPNTTDLNLFGEIVKKSFNKYIIKKFNSSLIYNVEVLNDHNHVKIYKIDEFIIEFKDYFTEDHSTFTRVVEDQTYVYIKGEIIVKKVLKRVSYLESINPDTKIS